MPEPPLPPDLDTFLARPNPAVVATLRPDGAPHTAATWYDWEDGRVLLNMEESRLRLKFLRRDPRVSLTVLDEKDWYKHVTLMGRVVSLEDDPDLVDIDRLSQRYRGGPYRVRDRKRVSAWVEVERWYAWNIG
ncbi:MAG: PPOX class F420-dependent oxidoreductase [Actinobacteria bacterium]|nr:MAG: PPOX class F420-dependent oxidoreductase [Actinomycetota bacterium]